MAIISGGYQTSSDLAIGISFVIFGGVSTILSVMIIIYYRNCFSNPSRFLFRVIAVCDLLISLFIPFVMSYWVLKTEDVPMTFEEAENLNIKDVSVTYRVYTFFVIFLPYTPACITPIAMVIKFIGIQYPLKRISSRNIAIACCPLIAAQIVIIASIQSRAESVEWSWGLKMTLPTKVFKLEFKYFTLILALLPSLLQVVSLVLSITVLRYLYHLCTYKTGSRLNVKTRKKKAKGAMKKILFINFGTLLYVTINISVPMMTFLHYGSNYDPDSFTLLNFTFPTFLCLTFIPSFLALYDSVVFAIFTPEIFRCPLTPPGPNSSNV